MLNIVKKIIPDSVRKLYAHYLVDVYIVSYPKCGRTWLRMLLGTAINKQYKLGLNTAQIANTFDITKNLHLIPNIKFTHDDDPHVKHFTAIQESKKKYRNKSLVLLVRDPRDVIVSSFYQLKFRIKRKDILNLSMSDFIRYDKGGIRNIVKFYNIWSHKQNTPLQLLVIRYEDMIENTELELSKFFDFLNINVNTNNINYSVKQNSFENLKKKEKKGVLNNNYFTSKSNKKNEKYLKVRKGKVRGFKDELSNDDIRYIDNYIRRNLSDLYESYIYDSFNI